MPHGDTCVSHLFEPGAIPASAGMPPILPTTAEPPSGQATIAAAIAEAAAATDATTGLSIVAMIEAATAASTVDVALIYSVAIVEGATASDVAMEGIAGAVTEAVTASEIADATTVTALVTVTETVAGASAQDATVAAGTVLATLDGVASNVTLTNGNLTATHSTATSLDGARSATVKSTGKYYFEVTCGLMRNGDSIASLLSTGTYNDLDNLGTNCTTVYGNGAIWSNNGNSGKSIAAYAGAAGPVIGVAIDLGAR